MSEETAASAPATLPTESNQQTSEPTAKPTLEQAFAGGGKSKLNSNLTRTKKLGKSSFTEGSDDLTATSKKAKSALQKKDPAKETVSFDKAPAEKSTPVPEKENLAKDPIVETKPQDPKVDLPKKMYKVKVDGQEAEVDEEELVRGYQIRKASDKVFRESAEIQKKNEAFVAKFKDPNGVLEVLQAFGHDPRKLAEEYLGQVLTFETMTPEQQKIAVLEAREAQRDREVKSQIAQQQAQRAQQEQAQHADVIQKAIIGALETNPDLPKDAGTVRKVIEQMRLAIKAQAHLPDHLKEDVTPESVMNNVRISIEKDIRAKVGGLNPEQLAKFLGKEKLDEYRKWELTQIKNPIGQAAKPQTQPLQTQQKKRHYKTMEEFKQNQIQNGVRKW